MRRPTRIKAIGPSHPKRPTPSRRGIWRFALSSKTIVRLAFAGIFGCSLYAAFLIGKGHQSGGMERAVSVDEHVGGNVPAQQKGQESNKGKGFRQLNALGFENGDGTDGEWKTCRAYREDELALHKRVRESSSKWLFSI